MVKLIWTLRCVQCRAKINDQRLRDMKCGCLEWARPLKSAPFLFSNLAGTFIGTNRASSEAKDWIVYATYEVVQVAFESQHAYSWYTLCKVSTKYQGANGCVAFHKQALIAPWTLEKPWKRGEFWFPTNVLPFFLASWIYPYLVTTSWPFFFGLFSFGT